jgi:hypothetical protein
MVPHGTATKYLTAGVRGRPQEGSAMDKELRYRHKTVSLLLSDEEYRELQSLCRKLNVPLRQIVLFGMRRAKTILARERRKQRRNGQ